MLYEKLMFAVCIVLICVVSAAIGASRKSGGGEVPSNLKVIVTALTLGALSYLVRMSGGRHYSSSRPLAVALIGCGVVAAIVAWTRRYAVHQE